MEARDAAAAAFTSSYYREGGEGLFVRHPGEARGGGIKAFLLYNRGRDSVEVHVEQRRSITVIPVTSSAAHRVSNGPRRVEGVS